MHPGRFSLILLILWLVLAPRFALAAMTFCNRTQNTIEAAFGYRETGSWVSEGWWRIEPGDCADVYGQPLTQRFYFYYATSLALNTAGKPPLTWTGKYKLCIDTKAFRIEGDEDCEVRNYQTQGFQQIDIGSATRGYTLDFNDSEDKR
jgi:uncharacterized membrane protein